ncbi:MAG: hypothetical protein GY733_00145 [bacterium]|nr:hypothetical protein [bacterium]
MRATARGGIVTAHEHDRFHPPETDDPYWTETCWFTFTVPERELSGQLYPFFRPNQNVTSGGAFFWDASGHQISNCRYAKNFWHLPIPEGVDLSDIELANGIRYRCLEPLRRYEIHYLCPDDGEAEVHLEYEALCEPNYLGGSHMDQPGRYRGTIRLQDELIDVDAYGMRDRSWGVRSQFGTTLHPLAPYSHGGYTYASASPDAAFHLITADFGTGLVSIHGFLLQDGEWAKLSEGTREVVERSAEGYPLRIHVTGRDTLGRELHAEGVCHNRLGVHLNPNLWTWNCLTAWQWNGTTEGWGEDHDNWSAAAWRRFIRGESWTPPGT